jgi:hypothetical protein
MTKTSKIKIGYILIGICLLTAGALLSHLLTNAVGAWGGTSAQGTVLDFEVDSTGSGFHCEKTIYTENGMSGIVFSGKITVDGTAVIAIVAEDGSVVYDKTYTSVTAQALRFEVSGLSPYTYYTLKFSSSDAAQGDLRLTTDQKLVKSPEHPEHPVHNKKASPSSLTGEKPQ